MNFVVIVVEFGSVLLIFRLVINCSVVIVVIFGVKLIEYVVMLNMNMLLINV